MFKQLSVELATLFFCEENWLEIDGSVNGVNGNPHCERCNDTYNGGSVTRILT